MSGEIDAIIADIYREIRNEIESEIKILEEHDYGSEIESIGIVPIIVNLTPELERARFFRERNLFSKKNKDADYRLGIDYDTFVNGNNQTNKLLIIKNIIDSIRHLSKKTKNFKAKKLENDILDLFKIDTDEIDKL